MPAVGGPGGVGGARQEGGGGLARCAQEHVLPGAAGAVQGPAGVGEDQGVDHDDGKSGT